MPEPILAPAPAAKPSPAPATASTPPPAPAAAPSQQSLGQVGNSGPSDPGLTGGYVPNAFDEIDAKFRAAGSDLNPKPEPKSDEPPAAAPKRGDDGKFAAPDPSSPKPGDKAKPVATGPKELREELERTRSEHRTASEERDALKNKIREFEAKGKDTDALVARLEAKEKEFETLQGELRALKQEASPEFKKQYEEPFNRAAKYAERVVSGMTKADGTPANFNADFAPLFRMPLQQAYAQAREVFGDDAAPAVMQQITELQRLDFQKQEAMEEEKKGWAEKAKAEEGRKVQARETWKANWQKVNEDLRNSVEQYRDPVDDKEAAEIRQKGYQIFDAEPKTPQEHLFKGAHIRHRVAAFGPNQLTIQRQQSEINRLKAELESKTTRQPNPSGRKPGGPELAPPEESWEDGALKHMASAR